LFPHWKQVVSALETSRFLHWKQLLKYLLAAKKQARFHLFAVIKEKEKR